MTSHPDTSVYIRLTAAMFEVRNVLWWLREKGANHVIIVAHQRKWLLQWNYNICKIQAHRPFHASLIGVVTCVGEQRYVLVFSAFLSITAVRFWPPTWRRPNRRIRKCPKCDITYNKSIPTTITRCLFNQRISLDVTKCRGQCIVEQAFDNDCFHFM